MALQVHGQWVQRVGLQMDYNQPTPCGDLPNPVSSLPLFSHPVHLKPSVLEQRLVQELVIRSQGNICLCRTFLVSRCRWCAGCLLLAILKAVSLHVRASTPKATLLSWSLFYFFQYSL